MNENEKIREALQQLDGTAESAVSLLTGLSKDEIAEVGGVAWVREETDPCERGTVGCSVRHPSRGPETDCETW